MLRNGLSKIGSWFTLDNIRKFIAVVGGRRFFATIGAGVVTSYLMWHGKITPEIYRDVVLGTVGLYIAGNTFQKNSEAKNLPKGE